VRVACQFRESIGPFPDFFFCFDSGRPIRDRQEQGSSRHSRPQEDCRYPRMSLDFDSAKRRSDFNNLFFSFLFVRPSPTSDLRTRASSQSSFRLPRSTTVTSTRSRVATGAVVSVATSQLPSSPRGQRLSAPRPRAFNNFERARGAERKLSVFRGGAVEELCCLRYSMPIRYSSSGRAANLYSI
jgi:hypothetical protein